MVTQLLKNGRKAMGDLDFTPSKEGFEYDDLETEINQVKQETAKATKKVRLTSPRNMRKLVC